VQLNTLIPYHLKERVDALAERRGCFRGRVVHEALEAYLTKAEKKAARAS